MRILYCDDDPCQRHRWQQSLNDNWERLRSNGNLTEVLDLSSIGNISDEVINRPPDTISFNDVNCFDGFLLDLLWPNINGNLNPHGIEIAEKLRRRYPEKAIMIFTVNTDPIHFNRLLNAGICGYLMKNTSSVDLCLQISESMARHRRAKGGNVSTEN